MSAWKTVPASCCAALGLFALFSLSACDPSERAANTGPDDVGSARVALAALPSGYLDPSSRAVLYLDVTGPGMSPIRVAAPLYEGKPRTLDVKGIPPGKPRVFHGLLVRIDSAQGDSVVTHEGADTTGVSAGIVTEVHLVLKAKAGGSAHVCIDVEGWPSNPDCAQPPKPQPLPKVAGCYALTVAKHGPKEDSLFKGNLNLVQKDSTLFAVLTWASGAKDTASGRVYTGNGLILGMNGVGQFSLKAMWDSAKGIYGGYFFDTARGIDGDASAPPAPCDGPVPPNETVKFDSLACWKVAQKTLDGRAMEGTLWVGWTGAALTGWFQWNWNNAGFAVDNGGLPLQAGALYLFGTLPGGFAHPERNALERGHYKAKRTASGTLELGAAYARAGAGDFMTEDRFADWSGIAYACPDQARATLAKLRVP